MVVKPLFEHQTKDYLSLQQNTSTHGENISLFLNDQRQWNNQNFCSFTIKTGFWQIKKEAISIFFCQDHRHSNKQNVNSNRHFEHKQHKVLINGIPKKQVP